MGRLDATTWRWQILKGESKPNSVFESIPADFLSEEILDLHAALLHAGLNQKTYLDHGTRSSELYETEQHLLIGQGGEAFVFDNDEPNSYPLVMLEVVAQTMARLFSLRDQEMDLAFATDPKTINDERLKPFYDHEILNHFLVDFSNGVFRVDATPPFTPTRLRGILDYIIRESDEHSLVNFSLFWNLWRFKEKSTKKGSVSPEKFLKTWFNNNLDAGAILDPESNQLYLIKNTDTAQYYSFPIHWRNVKINTGNRLKGNPRTEDIERMFSLYRRYVRGLASSLSFVRCASKLTRLGKLYTKPLEFTPYFGGFKKYVEEKLRLYDLEALRQRDFQSFLAEADMKASRNIESDQRRQRGERGPVSFKKWKLFDKFRHDGIPIDLPPKNKINQRQFIHHHLETNVNFKPLLISGDAGKGKTISISHFALEYVQTLEDLIENSTPYEMKTLQLPMFFRAKRLTTVLRKFNSSKNLLPVLWNGLLSTFPDIIHHIDESEFTELMRLWDEFQNDHDSSLTVFLDGMDECDSDASASEVMKLFNTPVFNTGNSIRTEKEPMLILSSRPSRLSLIEQTIRSFAIADMSADGYFSEHELSIEMPRKLCDAWGVTRESGEKLSEVFDKHRNTLIHPLFVGWFCFLIYDGRLDQIESSSNESQILQNNLISQIIEIGIASSLESRESRYTDLGNAMPDQKFVEILRSFVSVSYHFGITEPRLVEEKMSLLGLESNFPDDLRTSILHDCGILYLTGEQIEWTHKVVFEIMYADFYHAHHADLALGPLNVSDPVLSRLAQIQVESKQAATYDCAKLRLLFKYKRDEFIEMAQEIWQGSTRSSNSIPLLTLGEANILVPITTNRSELQIELARLFIESLNTPRRFALHWELIDDEHWERIIKIVMQSTERPYAEDLISFHPSETPIRPQFIRTELISSNDNISYCFQLYRRVLLSEYGRNFDTTHSIFNTHQRAGGLVDLFNIEYVDESNSSDFPITSWFSNRHRTESFDFPNDEGFTHERDELIDYVTREYVFAAYDRLFGEDLSESCIDYLWERTYGTSVTVVNDIGSGISENKEILRYCLERMGYWDFDEPKRFELDEVVVRGLLMMPFVHYSLNYHFNSATDSLLSNNPLLKVNQFHTVFKQPFELIKRFSANMDNGTN